MVPFLVRFLTFISVGILPQVFSLEFETRSCRILPSDNTWPDENAWDNFNSSVDGRLIRVVPDASPCHDPNFDEALCAVVRENWFTSEFQYVIVSILQACSNPCVGSQSRTTWFNHEFCVLQSKLRPICPTRDSVHDEEFCGILGQCITARACCRGCSIREGAQHTVHREKHRT